MKEFSVSQKVCHVSDSFVPLQKQSNDKSATQTIIGHNGILSRHEFFSSRFGHILYLLEFICGLLEIHVCVCVCVCVCVYVRGYKVLIFVT